MERLAEEVSNRELLKDLATYNSSEEFSTVRISVAKNLLSLSSAYLKNVTLNPNASVRILKMSQKK